MRLRGEDRRTRAGRNGPLRRLAAFHGVATSYVDESGVRRQVSDRSLREVLAVMGVPANSSVQVAASFRDARSARWQSILDPVVVVRTDRLPRSFLLRLPLHRNVLHHLHLDWVVKKERGGTISGQQSGIHVTVLKQVVVDGTHYVECAVPFPRRLPFGYHKLSIKAYGGGHIYQDTMVLIVVPVDTFLHPCVRGRNRTWGVTLQLYGVRSRKNWGIGDFRDLRGLIQWVGRELGADLLGVNPLHALPPGGVSPYSPSSRLFHHALYLDLEGVPEFLESKSLQLKVKSSRFQARLAALRRNPTVRYRTVERIKWQILEELFRIFQRRHLARHSSRAESFRRFVKREGVALERFALFRTLEERMARRGKLADVSRQGWRAWPKAYQHPDSPAVRDVARRSCSRLQFFQYVEWECRRQLRTVQLAAKRAGMAIGLYKDMAVGIDPEGADAWAFQGQLVAKASIGTPPELFSPSGQRWNLAPFHPELIRSDGYRLFADCYRRSMQHAGIIRIDHAMGLFRLFWIPEGLDPSQGTYVRYPADDFLGILGLESHRQHVMVIGEDLGTVTPAIRHRLMEGGLLSYRLLLFEQSAKGAFAKPSRFPRHAAAAVATHDLPTLKGFWIGRDIELKARIGLYKKAAWRRRDQDIRARDKQALLDALAKERLLPNGCPARAEAVPDPPDDLCRSI
ncbi:4-alpha-glucanotransferase, partial [Petrachloros mirabilis]